MGGVVGIADRGPAGGLGRGGRGFGAGGYGADEWEDDIPGIPGNPGVVLSLGCRLHQLSSLCVQNDNYEYKTTTTTTTTTTNRDNDHDDDDDDDDDDDES